MSAVDVEKVTDLLETKFVAEVANQERRDLNVLKAWTVEVGLIVNSGSPAE